MRTFTTRALFIATVVVAGCGEPRSTASSGTPSATDGIVFLNVTSDATADPQSVDMAMKLAGFSLDEGRKVVMFFNVKGVLLPKTDFPAEFGFQENKPLIAQLGELIARGVDVHVCPICMKGLGVEASDLIEGAKVTTRPSLFSNIGAETAVFTY